MINVLMSKMNRHFSSPNLNYAVLSLSLTHPFPLEALTQILVMKTCDARLLISALSNEKT